MHLYERVFEVEAPPARAEPIAPTTSARAAPIAPVRPEQRIQSLDVLRGAAVLGILVLNINAFGMPLEAYSDASVYGGTDSPNLAVWLVVHVLFEQKMRAIFSMLFGASLILM